MAATIANADGRAAMGVGQWAWGDRPGRSAAAPDPALRRDRERHSNAQSAGGAIKEVRESRRSGFHMEEAASRTRIGRGRAMFGMPFGSGTAHVVKLGAVGVEERLEQAQQVGKLDRQHRRRTATHLNCSSRRSHDALLSARSPPAFWPEVAGAAGLPIGRPRKRPGSAVTFGRIS